MKVWSEVSGRSSEPGSDVGWVDDGVVKRKVGVPGVRSSVWWTWHIGNVSSWGTSGPLEPVWWNSVSEWRPLIVLQI